MGVCYQKENVTIYNGDCRGVLPEIGLVDAVVTDPPYGLKFMGKGWDKGVPGIEFWQDVISAMKPGAHLLSFGGTRTHHRLMCAIEDAGFEIRDCVMWVYGTGFPKGLNIGKAIDKMSGVEDEWTKKHGQSQIIDITVPATEVAKQWEGWGTALKPAWEPIILARKPPEGTIAQNVLKHGVGGLNIDGCRVHTEPDDAKAMARCNTAKSGRMYDSESPIGTFKRSSGSGPLDTTKGRWPADLILSYPEDEYKLRDDVTLKQLKELAEWLDANA